MDPYDDEPRPRRAGADPARREPLMQRRLRAARGENDDDDLDDYPSARYPRGQGGYAPSYGGAGSCASAALYLLVGGGVVFLVFLFLGRQLFGSVTGGVSSQIRQIVATPTPTIRDRGGTIQQIRSLNRLETQSFSVERVIEASSERGNLLDTFLGDKLLLIASGDVVAGVDLSKLTDADVTLSPDGKSITLRLPPSEILSKSLNNDRTRVYDRRTGILAQQQKDLETQARQEAENEILKAACEGQIMQKAADEAQRSMERFLKLLDFETVNVTARAGACVAPSAPPLAAPTATAP